MRIDIVTTYTIYVTAEEFELLYNIAGDAGFGYEYFKDEDEYKIVANEDILDDIKYFLEREQSHQLYDECNRNAAERIGDLLDSIYYELNYNM